MEASGNIYNNTYWNSLTSDMGVGTLVENVENPLLSSGTLGADINATVAANSGMDVGKLYTSTGVEVLNQLTWKFTISCIFSDSSGLGKDSGTAGTTPDDYLTVPRTVTSTALSLTGASFTITMSGLTANQTYTLTFGGNAGLADESDFDFYFTSNDGKNIQGTGGEADGAVFTVGDASAYALSAELTADDKGELSFVGYGMSDVNITYLSMTGDWDLVQAPDSFIVVPEPTSCTLGLFALATFSLRRRRLS